MSRDRRVKLEAKSLKSNMSVAGFEMNDLPDDVKEYMKKENAKKIEAKNPWQDRYLSALRNDEHVIGFGPAGTGKTFLAAAVAGELLNSQQIQQIIMVRPAVECGEKMGFLPGSLFEKYAPYVQPYVDGLATQLGGFKNVRNMIENEINTKLQPQPLNLIRGRTFDNAVILADEAQNFTVKDIKALLTRVGENCRIFITGDVDQTDLVLKNGEQSGLMWWVNTLRKYKPEVEIVDFSDAPCVRSAHCAWILDTFKKAK